MFRIFPQCSGFRVLLSHGCGKVGLRNRGHRAPPSQASELSAEGVGLIPEVCKNEGSPGFGYSIFLGVSLKVR